MSTPVLGLSDARRIPAGVDQVAAPDTYDEFYRNYFGYTRHRLMYYGIPGKEADDATADLFRAAIEADVLGKFDPEHPGAKWEKFWARHVAVYAMGLRDRVHRRWRREVLKLDAPIADVESGMTYARFLEELAADPFADVSASAEADTSDLERFVADYLASVDRGEIMVALWERAVDLVRAQGSFTVADLVAAGPWPTRSGTISATTGSTWLAKLRVHVRDAVRAYRS